MAEIRQLTEASPHAVDDLNVLLAEMRGERSVGSMEDLGKIVSDPNVALVVAEDDGHIVGMGMISILQKMGKKKAFIEDIVVLETQRGKGLGTAVMKKLMEIARSKNAFAIVLTSNKERKAAHALYEKLGFEKRDTHCYRLKL